MLFLSYKKIIQNVDNLENANYNYSDASVVSTIPYYEYTNRIN